MKNSENYTKTYENYEVEIYVENDALGVATRTKKIRGNTVKKTIDRMNYQDWFSWVSAWLIQDDNLTTDDNGDVVTTGGSVVFSSGDTHADYDGTDIFEFETLEEYCQDCRVEDVEHLDGVVVVRLEEEEEYKLRHTTRYGATTSTHDISSTTIEEFINEVARISDYFGEDEEVVLMKGGEVMSNNLIYTSDDWRTVTVDGVDMVACSDDFAEKPYNTNIKALNEDGNVVYVEDGCIYEDKFEYKKAMTMKDFGGDIKSAWLQLNN